MLFHGHNCFISFYMYNNCIIQFLVWRYCKIEQTSIMGDFFTSMQTQLLLCSNYQFQPLHIFSMKMMKNEKWIRQWIWTMHRWGRDAWWTNLMRNDADLIIIKEMHKKYSLGLMMCCETCHLGNMVFREARHS